MNRILKCFVEKRYKLSKLFLCKIFEVKSNGQQVGIKILYELNPIEHNYFYDPITGERYYTLYFANIGKDKYYCEVCDTLFASISDSPLVSMYKKGFLKKEQIQELNEFVSQTYSQIETKN